MLSGSKRANSSTIETDLSVQNLYYCGAKEISGLDHNKPNKIGIPKRYMNPFPQSTKNGKDQTKKQSNKNPTIPITLLI